MDAVRCPSCGAGYPAGVWRCGECGASMADRSGLTAPAEEEPVRGALTVVEDPDAADGPDDPRDLFADEERAPRRMILAVMVPEDGPALVAALEREGIGARLGAATDDGGVEVLVHDAHLPEAQAVLVDFTGDESLAEYVVEAEATWGQRDQDRGFVQVATGPMADMAHVVDRIRDAGIDVILWTSHRDGSPVAAVGVHEDRFTDAQRLAGIEA